MKKYWILSIAAVLLVAGAVSAAPHGPGHKGFGGPDIRRLANRLDLDETQREALAEIADEGRERRKVLRQAMEENREALAIASDFDAYDASLVAELAAQQGALHAQKIEFSLQSRNEMLGVLTAEQRAELAEIRERRKERRMNRRANRDLPDPDDG